MCLHSILSLERAYWVVPIDWHIDLTTLLVSDENASHATWTNWGHFRSGTDWPKWFSTANRSWWTSSLTYPCPSFVGEVFSQGDGVEDRDAITDDNLRRTSMFFSGIAHRLISVEKCQNETERIIDQPEREGTVDARNTFAGQTYDESGGRRKERRNIERSPIERRRTRQRPMGV